jgi:predicted amidohydrolase
MRPYRIGFFQFEPEHRNPSLNIERVRQALSYASADLIVLPELCTSGYMFSSRTELADFAEKVPEGLTCQVLARVSRERNMSIVFGIAESGPAGTSNSAVLVTPSGGVHVYRKTHLFMDEKNLFERGENAFVAFDAPGCRVGLLICFDYFFPEPARRLALDGALVVCHPANLVLDYAQSMTPTRAAENRVFWVLANRTGTERLGGREMAFTGSSQIVDPTGKVLYRAKSDTEELVVVEVDLERAVDKRVTPNNDVFRDRRTDLY